MFDTILVPTDDSAGSERAFETAMSLAGEDGATVHVLAVVDERGGEPDDTTASPAAAFVDRMADRVDADGIPVTPVVRDGVVHDTILEYATETDVDLVVMGTHGRTGVRRYLLGSVTEKVVRLSDAPVLTVKADGLTESDAFEQILLPTDGSEDAQAAVAPAAALASGTDATVHALSVIDTRSMGVDMGASVIVDDLEAAATEAVESVVEALAEYGVDTVETTVSHGYPYQAVRTYVEDHDIDLVVMGTHGRTGIDRYLLGSVTEKVVRTSPVPVLTVRSPTVGDERQ